jgi:hypothetical protein
MDVELEADLRMKTRQKEIKKKRELKGLTRRVSTSFRHARIASELS